MTQTARDLSDQTKLSVWITDWLARELRISQQQITLVKPFTSYGVDSMHATMLVGDLEEHLSRRLSPTLAWDYPTVEKLAEYLSQLAPEAPVLTDADLLARIDELPEEELDRLIQKHIGEHEAS
jgi:acyl carrier protein